MNETFNFKRFATYFKYDLTQMWRNHSKAAILIGGASAIFYVTWLLFSLVFTQEWHTPVIEARVVVFTLAFAALEFYQVRTYGHLTEKKAGSAYLMVPASRAEKFVSMLLITLVVIPFLFMAVYLLLDGFLSLVDPTYGKALITGFSSAYVNLINGMAQISGESPFTITPSMMIIPSIASFICSFLYFLLCGICFKRNKLVGALAILFILTTVLSLVMGLVLPPVFENMDLELLDEDTIVRWTHGIINGGIIFSCLCSVGLGWGVWHRIKTLQH
ncbi:MAG: hypothetical protein IJU21_00215 [Bacteroidales bacterium]|nr:hypothetical protein [Bacteroidales bacterium]